jgi:hypothetical protein
MREDRKMHAEPATVEVPVLKLPPDLVTELNRHSSGKNKRRLETLALRSPGREAGRPERQIAAQQRHKRG